MVKKQVFEANGEHDFSSVQVSRADFPDNFVFGVATSAYQIEGASNQGGRGASIWDAFSHTKGKIIDGSNGDIAVDHYHRYKDCEKYGLKLYGHLVNGIDGLGAKVNDEGIAFYNNLINELLEKGIQPYVTLYHWDLPLHLQESFGGWLNKEIIKYFSIYADTCFANFGDRVKNWITINEPLQTAVNGYVTGEFAPGRRENMSREPYLAAHHQILAHAAAVSIYRSKYKEKQGGQVGLVVDCEGAVANSDKIEDKLAAERRLEFQVGWYLRPLYYGDYPEIMRQQLGDQLPRFTEEDKELLKNSMDFIGLNQYTSRFIAHLTNISEENGYFEAQEMERIVKWDGGEMIGEKAASEWLYVVPWGIRRVLNYIAQTYNNPLIYVTENGMDDEDNNDLPLHEILDDKMRVRYYKAYLAAVSHAIKDGVDVRGYFAWSLVDNFEWAQGYTKRFGLVYVDYKNGLVRHPKSSAYWFSRFLRGGEKESGKED